MLVHFSQSVCVFRTILGKGHSFLKCIKRLIFVIETQYSLQARIRFLNIIYMYFEGLI